MAGKNARKNFYAVRRGRDAPAIYRTWDEAKLKVHGFSGAQFKGFESRDEAQAWMNEAVPMAVVKPPPPQALPPTPIAARSPPRSSSSGLSKRKHDVISLISSDEATPEDQDLPVAQLRRPRPRPSADRQRWPLSSSQNSSSSSSARTPIVIDGSDEETEITPSFTTSTAKARDGDDLMRPASHISPFFAAAEDEEEVEVLPPSRIRPPSPRPHMPALPKNDPLPVQPTNTVHPLASTSSTTADSNADPEGKPETRLTLSDEQRKLLELAKRGKSVFFTGSAGTGKSVLLREMIRELRIKHHVQAVHVTGSTGMAAVSIGGTTLHSFASLGLAKEKQESLLAKLMSPKGKRGRERWQSAQVLIIDEISMIDCRFFDKLDFVARHIRNSLLKPFGGLQVIATGDFFQLPPVTQGNVDAPYCFKAMCFRKLFSEIHVLRQVFRQKDQSFVDLLNKMRQGTVDKEMLKVFESLDRPLHFTDGIEATHLMSTKVEVGSINETQLRKLEGNIEEFKAVDKAPMSKRGFSLSMEEARQKLDRSTIAEYILKLKPKAQVMLIKNLPDFGLVNGSRGIVLGFYSINELVNLAREGEVVSIAFDPRDQDRGKKDRETSAASAAATQFFEDEAAYANYCADLYEAQLEGEAKRQNGRMFFDSDGRMLHHAEQPPPAPQPQGAPQQPILVDDGPDAVRWPVVKFARGVTLMVPPMNFEVQNGDGEVEASRQAVPLILAWALSIHKSQGQTIERLKVDLGSIFEKGQAYVAVSRATSLNTLEVRNFKPRCVMSAPEVAKFYAEHT